MELLKHGDMIKSPGGHYVYKIIGPCCRLYDREQLPWPSCSLQWRGKQPSWRRIGPRYVADMATRRSPSYSVQLIQHLLIQDLDIVKDPVSECLRDIVNERKPQQIISEPIVRTWFHQKLDASTQRWWFKNNHYNPEKHYSKTA